MKKLFPLLLLSLTLVSCNESDSDQKSCDPDKICNSNQALIPNDLEPDPITGVPIEANTFDTNLSLVNFNASQEDKVLEAADLVRAVVATKEFRDAILNHTYDGKKTFVDNGGFSNLQIYNKILEGAEKLKAIKNNSMDVELELYYEATSTIGYTYASSRRIWMNTKYFNNYSASQVAGNLTHEWLHKLGFTHASSYNDARAYSVPYAIGYLMVRLAKQHVQ